MKLDAASEPEARSTLEHCCGARRWWEGMLAARPFHTAERVFAASERLLDQLTDEDWLEAFRHHPRIGESVDALRKKFASTAHFAAREQAGVSGADDAVLKALAAGNARYLERHGFIFIICATGQTAEAMLAALKARIDNPREVELRIAAGEQRKITRLRLEKSF
jgi:2-oxo-4-hydroxy-4-carboxy-5-ureidoimidazoline decarboxylase